jgi:hypothetical protein
MFIVIICVYMCKECIGAPTLLEQNQSKPWRGGDQRDDERLDNRPGKNFNQPGLELIKRQAEVWNDLPNQLHFKTVFHR